MVGSFSWFRSPLHCSRCRSTCRDDTKTTGDGPNAREDGFFAHVTREGQARKSVETLVCGVVQQTRDNNDPSDFRHGSQGPCETCHHSARKKGGKDKGACVRGLYEQSLRVSTSLAPSMHYLELTPNFKGGSGKYPNCGPRKKRKHWFLSAAPAIVVVFQGVSFF